MHKMVEEGEANLSALLQELAVISELMARHCRRGGLFRLSSPKQAF